MAIKKRRKIKKRGKSVAIGTWPTPEKPKRKKKRTKVKKKAKKKARRRRRLPRKIETIPLPE